MESFWNKAVSEKSKKSSFKDSMTQSKATIKILSPIQVVQATKFFVKQKNTSNTSAGVKAPKSTCYDCEYCNRTYIVKEHFDVHLESHAEKYKCEVCSKSFTTIHACYHHELSHEKSLYKCDDCGFETTYFQSLRKHVTKHLEKDYKHKCLECRKKFYTSDELKEHELLNEKPYICTVCKESFHANKKLLKHRRACHPELEEKKIYDCNCCDLQFDKKVALRRHLLHEHDSEGTKECVCKLCGKHLNNRKSLWYHLKVHRGEKPHICEFCSKSFACSSNLKKHRLIHTGEKPFKCDLCEKAFNHSSTLTIHRRLHTGEKPYLCQLCGKGFAAQGILTSHLKVHARQNKK